MQPKTKMYILLALLVLEVLFWWWSKYRYSHFVDLIN